MSDDATQACLDFIAERLTGTPKDRDLLEALRDYIEDELTCTGDAP